MATKQNVLEEFDKLFDLIDRLNVKMINMINNEDHFWACLFISEILNKVGFVCSIASRFLNNNINDIDNNDVIEIYDLLEQLQQRINEEYPNYRGAVEVCNNVVVGFSMRDKFETDYDEAMTKLHKAMDEYAAEINFGEIVMKGGRRKRRKHARRRKHMYKKRKSRYYRK